VRFPLLACLAVAGCAEPPPPDAAPGCNPLVGDDCLTPFPSQVVLRDGATTATGTRVAIGDAVVLHAPRNAPPLSAAPLNLHDGVSPSTPFVVYFARGVDPSQLPGLDDLDASTQPSSAIQVIDVATVARVPVFAELDANALPGDRRALLILLALLQPAFDATDPASFAPHLLAQPLPGVVAKQILMQEAVNDAQVSNIATRVLARTIGAVIQTCTGPCVCDLATGTCVEPPGV
jgi:hypothetical protein